MSPLLGWILFGILVIALLAFDLFVHRKAHVIGIREALLWSAFWIGLALLFNFGIYFYHGKEVALQFLAGYLIEKSLSVDNLFVFLLIFNYFCIPDLYQHGILFLGIIGALAMRAIFIVVGIALVHRFEWILYLFGAFLIFTGVKLALEKEREIHPEKNIVLRLFRRFVPVSGDHEGGKFFIRRGGKLFATSFFVVLIVVETTDVIFAVDSIPAILAITTDPFIVYSSNVFAILGLRSLYFALSGLMRLFHHLHYGLSLILVFIGIKMLLHHLVEIPIGFTLGLIAGVLTMSVVASIIWPMKNPVCPKE